MVSKAIFYRDECVGDGTSRGLAKSSVRLSIRAARVESGLLAKPRAFTVSCSLLNHQAVVPVPYLPE
jgi:hypothetical protein